MRKTRKKGFTIVELVIVIAVIAILAAVLIPTFGKVIENAKVSAAQADAKNIWTQYCVDKAAEGFNDFNGCIAVKDGTAEKYFFTIKNGRLDVNTVGATMPGIANYTVANDPVNGYTGLYKYTSST